MVGRGGGDRTHIPDKPLPLKNLIEDFSAAISSAGATARKVPARAQRVQDQSCECEEFRGNPAYLPCTAYGPPGACSRGKRRRYTEGFRGGLDCQLLIAG